MRHNGIWKLTVGVLLILLCVMATASAAFAADPDVSLKRGPTAIMNGSCTGAGDITVSNGYLAIAIAVDTAPPWGVPKGAILDGTTIKDGAWGNDRLTCVDFLPNAWAAWPNTYQRISVTTDTADKAVVTVERDYNKLQLVTTITVEKGSRFVKVQTVAKDPAGGEPYADILCGYTFCTSGGYMFGPYGMKDDAVSTDPYGKYVLGYDDTYSIGMQNTAADTYDGGSGWKDLYTKTTFAVGDEKTFTGAMQFEDTPSICTFVQAVASQRSDPTGAVKGSVTAGSGAFSQAPFVIVEKNGETFTWVEATGGVYTMDLPVGDYKLYAAAKDYSASGSVAVSVTAGGSVTKDFTGLLPSSTLKVTVTEAGAGTPLDARIQVTGGTPPVIGFLGKSVYFTDLEHVGLAEFKAAPGDLTLNVTSGVSFTSQETTVPVTVVAGQDQELAVKVTRQFDPAADNWFGCDMHHHSDILDGVTAPEFVVRSELAADLDYTLLSDHDSFANNQTMADLSASRGVPFIPSDEISPIWAHFNVLPMSLTAPVTIDPSGTAKEIIDAAHAAGMLISINHPFINYGYFTAQDDGTIPGGYCPDFDFIELQSMSVSEDGATPDERTFARTESLWTSSLTGKNKRYYIVGSTDTHDVWSSLSGTVRSIAKIAAPQAQTTVNFVAALKAGHSYVSEGPLVEPLKGLMFGETVKVSKRTPTLSMSLSASSVDGLKSVVLLSEGKALKTVSIPAAATTKNVTFKVKTTKKTWYAFIVEDKDGHRAITNPVWTKIVK